MRKLPTFETNSQTINGASLGYFTHLASGFILYLDKSLTSDNAKALRPLVFN